MVLRFVTMLFISVSEARPKLEAERMSRFAPLLMVMLAACATPAPVNVAGTSGADLSSLPKCPGPGLVVTRSNGGIARYDGPSGTDPRVCLITIVKDVTSGTAPRDGQQVGSIFNTYFLYGRSATRAYAPLQTLFAGPAGGGVSFMDVATYGQWEREYRKLDGEPLDVDGKTYRTYKVVQRVKGAVGNGFEGIYTTWFAADTLLPLKASSQIVSGTPDLNEAQQNWTLVSMRRE